MWLSGLSGLVAYMVVRLSNVKIGKNTKNAFLMLIFLFLYFSCLDLLNYFACISFFVAVHATSVISFFMHKKAVRQS